MVRGRQVRVRSRVQVGMASMTDLYEWSESRFRKGDVVIFKLKSCRL
jgi:hypothetical protein